MSMLDNFAALSFLVFLFAFPALSSLVINPVLLEFSPKTVVQEITLDNQSGETKAFEVSLKRWQQDASEDIYTKTSEIIVFPLAAKLAPHSKQKFRLIAKSLPQGTEQSCYRLFVNERPHTTTSESDSGTVTFLLNMTVPVFATGPQFKAVDSVAWSANVVKKDDSIVLAVANNGSKFMKIRDVAAKEVPSFRSGDWQYVLPKTTRTFTMPLAKKAVPKSLSVSYAAVESFEETQKSVSVALAPVKPASKMADKTPETKVATTK